METKFLELLKPQNVFLNKKRLGPLEDGGYVIPEYVLDNCTALFSYGIGYETRFEEDFYSKYQKPAYLFDHTIPFRTWEDDHLRLYSRGLGNCKDCNEFYTDYQNLGIDGYVCLKIDIEGGEYDYFLNTDISKMNSTVIGLILEVHWIDDNKNRNDLIKVLEKLNQYFVLCHAHGNNWGGLWSFGGKMLPKVMELSFINKKFVDKFEEDQQEYPIKDLDYPNNPKIPDYKLNFLTLKLVSMENKIEHYYKSVPSGWFNYEIIYKMAINRVKDDQSSNFVELGVWFGQSLCYAGVEIINSGKNIKLYGVDSFLRGDQPSPDAEEDPERYSEALRFTDPVKDVVTILKGNTHKVYEQFPDESIDFLFIDANHTYEDVMKDLQYWYPKIKKGGLVCGHDYEHPWPGLIKAVDEFFGKENFEVEDSCHTFIHYKK